MTPQIRYKLEMKTKNEFSYARKRSFHGVGAVLPYFLANNTYNNLTFTVSALFQSYSPKIQKSIEKLHYTPKQKLRISVDTSHNSIKVIRE